MKVLYKMKYSHKRLNISLWLKPFYFLICNRNVLQLTVMTEPSLPALFRSFTVESLAALPIWAGWPAWGNKLFSSILYLSLWVLIASGCLIAFSSLQGDLPVIAQNWAKRVACEYIEVAYWWISAALATHWCSSGLN